MSLRAGRRKAQGRRHAHSAPSLLTRARPALLPPPRSTTRCGAARERAAGLGVPPAWAMRPGRLRTAPRWRPSAPARHPSHPPHHPPAHTAPAPPPRPPAAHAQRGLARALVAQHRGALGARGQAAGAGSRHWAADRPHRSAVLGVGRRGLELPCCVAIPRQEKLGSTSGQGRGNEGWRRGEGGRESGRERQGRAGQGRAGQGRAGQGRAGQGRAGQGRLRAPAMQRRPCPVPTRPASIPLPARTCAPTLPPTPPLACSGDVGRAEEELSRCLRDYVTVERSTVWRDMAAMERKYAALSVKSASAGPKAKAPGCEGTRRGAAAGVEGSWVRGWLCRTRLPPPLLTWGAAPTCSPLSAPAYRPLSSRLPISPCLQVDQRQRALAQAGGLRAGVRRAAQRAGGDARRGVWRAVLWPVACGLHGTAVRTAVRPRAGRAGARHAPACVLHGGPTQPPVRRSRRPHPPPGVAGRRGGGAAQQLPGAAGARVAAVVHRGGR
jgi:hypothetical protein